MKQTPLVLSGVAREVRHLGGVASCKYIGARYRIYEQRVFLLRRSENFRKRAVDASCKPSLRLAKRLTAEPVRRSVESRNQIRSAFITGGHSGRCGPIPDCLCKVCCSARLQANPYRGPALQHCVRYSGVTKYAHRNPFERIESLRRRTIGHI